MSLSRRRFLALSTLCAAYPAAGFDRASGEQQTLTVAYPTDIASWEPSQTTPLQSAILKCVFDQPLALSDNLTLIPNVVSRYQWLDGDNQILELHFREDVLFHNGQPFTSEDFHFSFFERVRLLPNTLLAGVWGSIRRIDTPTPYSAIVYFSWPMATALAMLADIPAYLLPKRYYTTVGQQGFRANPVGSGPFKLVRYQPGMHVVLEANAAYWRGKSFFNRINFLIVPDKMTRLAMLETGQVDLSLNFSIQEATKIAASNSLQAAFQPTTGIILLQMVNKGALQDRRIRLAMHHAIDKKLISKALFQGEALPISTPAGKGLPAYDPAFSVRYDPDYARALLADAGYTRAHPLHLTFYTTKGALANDLEIAKAIAWQWQAVGITATVRVMTPAMLADYQNQQKFDGPVLQGWNPAAGDPATYSGLLLNPQLSLGLWKSADLGKPLAQLETITDPQQRVAEYQKFDRWQVSQGYSIPLFQGVLVTVEKPNLALSSNLSGIIDPYHMRRN